MNLNKKDILDELINEYNNLLLKYNEELQNFSIKKNKWVLLKGKMLNSTEKQILPANSVEKCKSLCSFDKLCSGATYVSDTCTTVHGLYEIEKGTPNTYAIIPKEKSLIINIKKLNTRLISINRKISNIINSADFNNFSTLSYNSKELNDKYKELSNDRLKIENTSNEENMLNIESESSVNKNYSVYFSLILVVIVLVVILIYVVIPKTQTSPRISINPNPSLNLSIANTTANV